MGTRTLLAWLIGARSTGQESTHPSGMPDLGSPRQLQWWDQLDVPITQPLSAKVDFCTTAIDRLALASSAQHAAQGDPAVTGQLQRWCLELRAARTSLSKALVLRDELDRMDRDTCEPQSWQHLTAAESALDAHIQELRGVP
jgi:hypothetical protein